MNTVNVHEAKTHFSRILKRVIAGEEVLIARSGKAVAKLVPLPRRRREPGRLRGQIRMLDDFDAPLPEALARAFAGEDP